MDRAVPGARGGGRAQTRSPNEARRPRGERRGGRARRMRAPAAGSALLEVRSAPDRRRRAARGPSPFFRTSRSYDWFGRTESRKRLVERGLGVGHFGSTSHTTDLFSRRGTRTPGAERIGFHARSRASRRIRPAADAYARRLREPRCSLLEDAGGGASPGVTGEGATRWPIADARNRRVEPAGVDWAAVRTARSAPLMPRSTARSGRGDGLSRAAERRRATSCPGTFRRAAISTRS